MARRDAKHYNTLLSLMRECSEQLEEKYPDDRLPGSPTITNILLQMHQCHPNEYDAIYGDSLRRAFEELNKYISSDEKRYMAFLEQVR